MRLTNIDDIPRLRRQYVIRREWRQLPQHQVAAEMRVHQSMISDLENGRIRDPRMSTWIRWACALGYHLTAELRPRGLPDEEIG